MAWLFSFVILLHVLGVFLMVAAMALQATVALLMRRSETPDAVRQTFGMAMWVPKLFAPASALILITGIYLAVVLIMNHAAYGWIVIAFLAFMAIGIMGKRQGKKYMQRVVKLLSECRDALSDELRAELQSPEPLTHLAFSITAVVAILILMIYTPGIWQSIAIIVAGLIAAFAVRAAIMKRLGTPAAAGKAPETDQPD